MKLVNKTTGIVEYNGSIQNFLGIDAYRHPEVNADFEIILSKQEQLRQLREKIYISAGDIESILGITADATQLQLEISAEFYTDVAGGMNIKPAAQKQAEKLATLKAQLDSGEIKMPYKMKGIDIVISDIGNAANAVTKAISDNQPIEE